MDLKERINQMNDIQDGFVNVLKAKLGTLEESIAEEGLRRFKICEFCPIRIENKCSSKKQGIVKESFYYYGELRNKGDKFNGCSCNLHSKVLSKLADCPGNFWKELS
jgi:hypothetical protein